MKAVITADIIDYSGLDSAKADEVLKVLHGLFGELKSVRSNVFEGFSVRRGDSIQGEVSDARDSLRVALMLKTAINRISFGQGKKRKSPVNVRIAIGVGEVISERDTVGQSFGEAYLFSGRLLDSMKKQKRVIAAKTIDEEVNMELDTEFRLLEVIMNNWKVTSADVLYLTLSGFDEKQTALRLGISQSAVNQRKKSAGWNAVNAMLKRYEDLIDKLNK
ncbi:MAG: hypothetical protein GXO47_11475 [Chlorobi bacterium]|nr:hypothetical protein [Chlorobiota bacterium]